MVLSKEEKLFRRIFGKLKPIEFNVWFDGTRIVLLISNSFKITMLFTKAQWISFKTTMSKTIDSTIYSEDDIGCSGIDVLKGEIYFYNLKIQQKIYEVSKSRDIGQKEFKKIKQKQRDIKKHRLTKQILFKIGENVEVDVPRRKFTKFRNFILAAETQTSIDRDQKNRSLEKVK